MASNVKQFLLEAFGLDRLRELSDKWRCPVQDARLRAPGIAKLLARKRSVTIELLLHEMRDEELEQVRLRLGLAPAKSVGELRRSVGELLSQSTWRQVRRQNAQFPTELEAVSARLLEVIDGDTIRVVVDGAETLVRLRGIDTPETSVSDKAERELDRTGIPWAEMCALGEEAKQRLHRILGRRVIYLHRQLTPGGPKPYLHHHQYRLLAFVTCDEPDGPDVGEQLLRDGYALVWPRGIRSRRYTHPQVERYLEICNKARVQRPGLWMRGLQTLCPRGNRRPAEQHLEPCMETCFPGRWDEAEGETNDGDRKD